MTNPARAEFYVQDQAAPAKIFMYGACSLSRTPGAPLGSASDILLMIGVLAVILSRQSRAQ